MLELRPHCERCNRDLAPNDPSARIGSYECTFCVMSVDEVFANVCPNCGGGFVPRPIRPATASRNGVSLAHQPAGSRRYAMTRSIETAAALTAALRDMPPAQR
ncbi:MAG: DUF1272 domain-containing protein [Pseudomonadota bacterium]